MRRLAAGEERDRMKLTREMWFRAGKWMGICLIATAFVWVARAQSISTTAVQGTVYLANGIPGSGTLQLSWPAFTTSNNLAVAAGRTNLTIGSDGFVNANLAPNLGASPAGLYYTAVYHMSDGTTSTEYWVVPAAAQATLALVRAQVMPAAQAVQAVNKAYVDQAIQSMAQGYLTSAGGALSGPLYLSGDPTQSLQAADKHYVDSNFSQAVQVAENAALPQAKAANQLPLSVNAGNSQYPWTGTINIAGIGAAIPTGPASSTSGNVTTFAGNPGQIQDSGVALNSLALLTGTAAQTFAGPITGKQLGSAYMADQFAGADASLKINACITAVIAAGGGTCDATALGGNQAMSQQINLGPGGTWVTLLLPNQGKWTWNLTDGVSCGIKQFDSTSLIGTKSGGSWGGLTLAGASTAKMDSLYCTDPNNQIYVRAEGFTVQATGTGGTYANGILHVHATFDESSFSRIIGINLGGDVWHIDNGCCGTKYDNIQGFSSGDNGVHGGVPLTINSARSISINDSTFNGPAVGKNNIVINSGGDIQFRNIYMEKYGTSDFGTPMVYLANNSVNDVSFNGGYASTGCTATGCSQWIFENHSPNGISIKNFGVDYKTTNGVNDVANGRTWLTDGNSIREYTTTSTTNAGSFVSTLTGDTLNVYTPSGPVMVVAGASSFTPTAVGWYRLISSLSSNCGSLIFNGGYDNKYAQSIYDFCSRPWSTSFITARSPLPYVGAPSGPIDQIESSNDGSGHTYLDVHVSDVTSASMITAVFMGAGIPHVGIVASPVVGATPGTNVAATINLNNADVNSAIITTGSIQTSAVFLTSLRFAVGGDYAMQADGSQNVVINPAFHNVTVQAGSPGSPRTLSLLSSNANCGMVINAANSNAPSFSCGLLIGSGNQTTFDANGLKHEAGSAPTASAGTITGTNSGGYVSNLSGATSLTITFANSGWTSWASCTANTSVSGISAAVTSAPGLKASVTFTFSAALTGGVTYHCDGN
jgi:hypothetical protein